MRSREEIEADRTKAGNIRIENQGLFAIAAQNHLILEVLLDIRDLLAKPQQVVTIEDEMWDKYFKAYQKELEEWRKGDL